MNKINTGFGRFRSLFSVSLSSYRCSSQVRTKTTALVLRFRCNAQSFYSFHDEFARVAAVLGRLLPLTPAQKLHPRFTLLQSMEAKVRDPKAFVVVFPIIEARLSSLLSHYFHVGTNRNENGRHNEFLQL